MVAVLRSALFVFALALSHHCAESVFRGAWDRVISAYNTASDNCKQITDFSSPASKSAADKWCEQAFRALDQLKLNTCSGWRRPGCRLVQVGQPYQCTCIISTCNEISIRSDIVTSIHDCAPALWTRELSSGQRQFTAADFQQAGGDYNNALATARSRRTYKTSRKSSNYSSVRSSIRADSFGGVLDFFGPERQNLPSSEVEDYCVCPVCRKRYRSQHGLQDHMKSHMTDDTTCHLCNQIYSTKANLKRHLSKTHPEIIMPKPMVPVEPLIREPDTGRFVCKKCGKSYINKKDMKAHAVSHETLGTYCSACDRTLASIQSYNSHKQRVHPEVAHNEQGILSLPPGGVESRLPFACSVCQKRYGTKHGLRDHYKSHTTDDTTCHICCRVHSTRANFKRHMSDLHPEVELPEATVPVGGPTIRDRKIIPLVCDKCGKPYMNKKQLKVHSKIHDTQETYCVDCKRTFSAKSRYNSHMQKEHPEKAQAEKVFETEQRNQQRPVKCETCKRGFKNSEGLRHHKKVHEGKTICDKCGLKFQSRSSFYAHKKKEHGN